MKKIFIVGLKNLLGQFYFLKWKEILLLNADHSLFLSRKAWRTAKKKKAIPDHFLSKGGKNPR